MARMGDSRGQQRVLWGDLRGRDHWEDLGVDVTVKFDVIMTVHRR